MKLKVIHHSLAPMFRDESNPELVLEQVTNEISSGNYSESRMQEVFRQAGFVNQWFFLKYIAGYSGPFDKINSTLHLDMSNFFMDNLFPGNKMAAFEGRSFLKSTIFTIGGMAWVALRDPDTTCALFSAVMDRSMEFMHTVQRVYDTNELFKWLYPEYVPEKNQKRWNDLEMVLPNRTRIQTSATIAPHGAMCSTAGIHAKHLFFDDIVGDTQLTADRQSGMEMFRTSNWVKSNIRTLLSDVNGNIWYTGTRYANDDAHAFIFESIKAMYGCWDDLDYEVSPTGEWNVYYRTIWENGINIYPEMYSDDALAKMAVEDPWTLWTQVVNHPKKSGISELVQFDPPSCKLDWQEDVGFVFLWGKDGKTPLSSCDLVQPVDPAASERGNSAKTSRSALLLLAHAPDDKRFLFGVKADYVAPSMLMDWMFINAKKYREYLRSTPFETQGAFKLFEGLIRDEERRRALESVKKHEKPVYLHVRHVSKTGNKESMIRAALEPLLRQDLLYVEELSRIPFMKELTVFPSSKMDILDALTLGINSTIRPLDVVEVDEDDERREAFYAEEKNVAGY